MLSYFYVKPAVGGVNGKKILNRQKEVAIVVTLKKYSCVAQR